VLISSIGNQKRNKKYPGRKLAKDESGKEQKIDAYKDKITTDKFNCA